MGGVLSLPSRLCLPRPVTQLLHSAKNNSSDIVSFCQLFGSPVPALAVMSPTSPDFSFSWGKWWWERGINFTLLTELSSSQRQKTHFLLSYTESLLSPDTHYIVLQYELLFFGIIVLYFSFVVSDHLTSCKYGLLVMSRDGHLK